MVSEASVREANVWATDPAPYPAPYPPIGRPPLLDAAREMEPLLLEAEHTIETERRMPKEITDRLYENGIYRAFLPREFEGGLEVHPLEWLDAVEEISRVNGSAGWLCMLHTGVTFLAPDVMEKLLQEDRWIIASNVGRAAGKAVRVEGGYRISGRWPFTSGSPEANWLSGRSILYDDEGNQVTHPHDGLPWFITAMWPAKDVTLIDTWDSMGLRGTGSGDFEIKDLFVPQEMVNEAGIWERPYDRALFRFWFPVAGHGAHALGLAKAALEEFTKQVHKSARHGSFRQASFGKEGTHQWTLGKAHTMVDAARAHLWTMVAEGYEAAQESWPIEYDLRVRVQASIANAVHVSLEVIEMLFKQVGAPAVFRGNRLERIYRDIVTAAAHGLISDTAFIRFGQYYMTRDLPDGPEIDLGGTNFIPGPHPQLDRN